jgi:hypothetical protein
MQTETRAHHFEILRVARSVELGARQRGEPGVSDSLQICKNRFCKLAPPVVDAVADLSAGAVGNRAVLASLGALLLGAAILCADPIFSWANQEPFRLPHRGPIEKALNAFQKREYHPVPSGGLPNRALTLIRHGSRQSPERPAELPGEGVGVPKQNLHNAIRCDDLI